MSMRITQTMVSHGLMDNLRRAQNDLARTQEKIASGGLVSRPGENPQAMRALIDGEAQLAALESWERGAVAARDWAEASDRALDTVTSLLGRARELTLAAANATTTPQAMRIIADELDQIAEAAKDAANLRIGDTYLFSGTATTTPAYAAGSDAYGGDSGSVVREIGPSVNVVVNALASDILGSGAAASDGKLLDTIRTIASQLRNQSPADLAAVRTTGLQNLQTNLQGVLSARGTLGAISSRAEMAEARHREIAQVTTESTARQAGEDLSALIMRYNSQQSAYQAALQTGAKIIQPSLVDFLR